MKEFPPVTGAKLTAYEAKEIALRWAMNTENSAVRSLRAAIDAIFAKDFETYAGWLAEDFAFEDRRSGLRSTYGKQKEIESARVVADLGVERYELEALETRGDRTALCRQIWHLSGWEVALLTVSRIDAEGRGLVVIMFDDDDLDAARAELEVQAAAS